MNTITFEDLRKIIGESVEDLPPNASYNKIDAELEKTNTLSSFCTESDFPANSKDEKAKALFNTFKKGWKAEYGKVQVEPGNVYIRELHPTQNAIYAEKSLSQVLNGTWNVKGYEYAVDAFLSQQSPVIEMGDPLVVCEISKTYYLIDGHHRWSKVYAFNPGAIMKAHLIKNSSNIFPTPDDVLKFAQGTLTALKNKSPIGEEEKGTNMYTMTNTQLVDLVNLYLDKKTVLPHIINAPLTKGSIKNVGQLIAYLAANIGTMKTYAPAGINDRIFMPQYPKGDSNPVHAVAGIAAESSKSRNGKTLTLEELAKILRF